MKSKTDPFDRIIAEEEQPHEIPDSWLWVEIGALSEVVGGGTPTSTKSSYFDGGNIPWVTPADMSGYSEMYISEGRRNITEEGLLNSSARILPKDSLLFSSRAPIGYVAIAKNSIATNQGFKSFPPTEAYLPHYGYWYLRSIKSLAESMASGTTFLELSGSKAAKIPFPLAPLAEQSRIVAKLDKAMQRVEASQARMEKLPGLLKQFRQAVLAAAVSGRLTEAWRAANPLLETTSTSFQMQQRTFETATLSEEEDEKYPTLPEGWQYVRLGDYAENLDNQRVPIASNLRASTQGQYPYYGASGVIDTIDKFTHDGEFLLIGEDGANLLTRSKSIAFLAKGKIWVNNHAHVLRCYEGYPNDYLSFYINSIDLAPFVTGSAQPKLAQKNMNRILIPVPSASEQQEIVRQVNHYFGLADQLESRFDLAAGLIEQLPQALLAKAFGGQLVPQDHSDEPASELLVRIKAAADKSPAKGARKDKTNAAGIAVTKQPSRKMKSKPVKTLPEFVERLSQLGGKAQPQQLLIEFDLQQDIDSFFDLLREGKSKGKLKVPTGEAGLIELVDDAHR